MSTDLALHSTDEAFALADRIAGSNLVPAAYRGKPTDLAIAVLYGRELGLPPMTALQRVVVINGKPTLDAQGFVSLIRQAGHSINGDVSAESATVVGKRGDNGDEMTVTFTMEDAKQADLLKNATYRKFPSDMLWARAVTQLARRLFADVMLSVSYAPEEMQVVANEGNGNGRAPAAPEPTIDRASTLRPPPGTPAADPDTGEIAADADDGIEDAEVVDDGPAGTEAKKATTQQVNKIKTALNRNLGIHEDGPSCEKVGELVGRSIDALADLTEDEAITALTELAQVTA